MVPPQFYDGGDDPTRRKSTLFCWECDRASPLDEEEWILDVDARGDYVRYVCPDCDTVLAERPRTDEVPVVRRSPAARAVDAWGAVLRASIGFWRVPFDRDPVGATATADGYDRR